MFWCKSPKLSHNEKIDISLRANDDKETITNMLSVTYEVPSNQSSKKQIGKFLKILN